MTKIKRHNDGRGFVRVSAKVAAMIAGDMDMSELDDEELMRGQTRAKDGSFKGSPPNLVPREMYAEWARRQMESGFQDMLGDLRAIVETVRNIATDPEVDENTRLRAAEMIMDRVYGKPKQAVDFTVHEKEAWQKTLEAIVVVDRSLSDEDDDIVDAEVVDMDTELDEWDD